MWFPCRILYEEFYKLYIDYLREPVVCDAHIKIIEAMASFDPDMKFGDIVDLGCGKSNEFYYRSHREMSSYIGIDLNAECDGVYRAQKQTFIANYRDLDTVQNIIYKTGFYDTDVFVSLFSTEITADYKTNLEFYNNIFNKFNNSSILVSGFYYSSKKYKNPIKENGGLLSFQTLEPIEAQESGWFTQIRIEIPVPSQLFGKDVVEVWKLLQRKRRDFSIDTKEV